MKDRKQHIVFLTPGFSESENDSTTIPALQVFLKSIRKALPEAKLTLLTFQFPFTKKAYNWHGIEIIPLNGQNKKIKKLWTWKKATQTLEKLNNRQKIDTIHSFWIGECSRIGQHFSNKYNCIHVVTVMGQDASIVNAYGKHLSNTNTKLVTLSKNNQSDLLTNYALISTIIPWHLDVFNFPELQQNEIDILGVGSLNTVKNYSTFIEIISVLIEKQPNINVKIIGDGKLKSILKTKINNLNLENNIELLGKLERNKVIEYMSKSKILLHTSAYESFGFVFLEALYSGMHIASYNVGLAQPSQYWKICKNKIELIDACETLHNLPNTKSRVELSTEKETTNAYTNLYNE